MTGDLPEDWFRPTREERATSEPAPERAHARQQDAQQQGAQQQDDERYTDQFKPNYVAHPPRAVPPVAQPPEPDEASATTTGGFHSVGVEPEPAPARAAAAPRRRTSRTLGTGVILAATLLVGMGIGRLLTHHDSSSTSDPQATSAPLSGNAVTTPGASDPGTASSTPTGAAPWTGRASTLLPTSITASCTAPSQKGYDGSIIPSSADRMTDGSLSTGWRCNGNGVGQTLQFEVPKGVEVVGLKLTNGYTKHAGGVDLYPQYRRITEVTWSFPGQSESYFVQKLTDGDETPQEVRIPPTRADQGIKMTISATTEPGGSQASRDAVVVTEVEFLVK